MGFEAEHALLDLYPRARDPVNYVVLVEKSFRWLFGDVVLGLSGGVLEEWLGSRTEETDYKPL